MQSNNFQLHNQVPALGLFAQNGLQGLHGHMAPPMNQHTNQTLLASLLARQ